MLILRTPLRIQKQVKWSTARMNESDQGQTWSIARVVNRDNCQHLELSTATSQLLLRECRAQNADFFKLRRVMFGGFCPLKLFQRLRQSVHFESFIFHSGRKSRTKSRCHVVPLAVHRPPGNRFWPYKLNQLQEMVATVWQESVFESSKCTEDSSTTVGSRQETILETKKIAKQKEAFGQEMGLTEDFPATWDTIVKVHYDKGQTLPWA